MLKFKELSLSARHYVIAFWISLGISIALLIGGFFTPPMAEISGSLLEATGLLFLYPALAFANKALEEGKTARISKGTTSITIGENGPEPPMEEETAEEGEIE